MRNYPVLLDIHTHCISSGHGSRDTVTDMAREAAGRGLKILGISDHGPKTSGAGSSSYFRNLRLAQRSRFGVSLLYGAELNILNEKATWIWRIRLSLLWIMPLSACTTLFFRAGTPAAIIRMAAPAYLLPVWAGNLSGISVQTRISTP